MRSNVRIHQPSPTTSLPAHEHAARRRRARTERPVADPHPRPTPTPAAPLGRQPSRLTQPTLDVNVQ